MTALPGIRVLLGYPGLLGALAVGCSFPDYTFEDLGQAGRGDGAPTAGGQSGAGGTAETGGLPATGGVDASVAGGSGGDVTGPDAALEAGPDVVPPRPECESNADCSTNPKRKLCDAVRALCVECLPTGPNCPTGLFCSPTGNCEIGCQIDADCTVSGELPLPDAGALDASANVPEAGADASLDGATSEPLDAGLDADANGGPPTFFLDGGRLECRSGQCVGCTSDLTCPPGALCNLGRCENGWTPTHPCPAGFTPCNGRCVDLTDDPNHCGSCDARCAVPGAVNLCVEGACTVDGCRTGFADCNGSGLDGCETDLRSNPSHCGACGNACSALPNAEPGCRDSTCSLGPCLSQFEDCDGEEATGCEVNLQLNADNCGACGNVCTLDHASSRCESGVCAIASCNAAYDDCDESPVNGCETHVTSDPNNCGTCEAVCSLENADVGCSSSSCVVVSCESPSADCNTDPTDGCEVDTSTDVANCGGCDDACILPRATATCSGGQCAIAACDAGWEDCNGVASDGCETNINGDEANCGACGVACSTNNTQSSTCALGACGILCATNFDDCDNDVSNGCETDLRSSVENCNACGTACTAGPGLTASCVNRTCQTSSCAAPTADCDGVSGCEVTDTTTNPLHCGGCGKECYFPNATATCEASTCAIDTCTAGFGDCNAGSGCETRLNTLSHCGGCDTLCSLPNATATCITGTCEVSFCASPFANCDGSAPNGCEVNTLSSVQHCGGCGNACSSVNGSPSCQNGSCAIACDAGFGNCNASAGDGCETPTTDDVLNCGSCGAVCAVQNGTAGCSGTTCTVAGCTPPFADCDGNYLTGCEANTSSSESHCGSCGNPCNLPNAISSCVSGACEIDACVAPYEDCDGDPANGCETDVCP